MEAGRKQEKEAQGRVGEHRKEASFQTWVGEKETTPPEPQIPSTPANENLPVHGTHLVIHPIQQPWDHREDGGAESLHVIREEADVSLEEAHTPSMAVDNRLGERMRRWDHLGWELLAAGQSYPKFCPPWRIPRIPHPALAAAVRH